jgi:hypothetical protein
MHRLQSIFFHIEWKRNKNGNISVLQSFSVIHSADCIEYSLLSLTTISKNKTVPLTKLSAESFLSCFHKMRWIRHEIKRTTICKKLYSYGVLDVVVNLNLYIFGFQMLDTKTINEWTTISKNKTVPLTKLSAESMKVQKTFKIRNSRFNIWSSRFSILN